MVEAPRGRRVLARAEFPKLLDALLHAGYRVVGPTVRDGAIVCGEIREEADLPIGWTDRQEAGTYRLERRTDEALFGYNVGPHSWKKYLFPARERLWTARRTDGAFAVTTEPVVGPPLAFLGMRACELAAVQIQDRVFDGVVHDAGYHARRSTAFRIAVQCGQAGATCFCASMGTGPAVTGAFDLALTELIGPGRHEFLVEVGSDRGAAILHGVPSRPATDVDVTEARELVTRTASSMGRRMDTTKIHDLLLGNLEHPRWQNVAERCLACTNCTLACPTCFCSSSEEVPDLSGTSVERWRRWDSCFNSAFSELHHAPVRKTTSSRYRQWLTHKLASWYDQFDSSGCVGCGRCITWCPVGIDLTEEVAAIRANPTPSKNGGNGETKR
jgi:sulfhydrogenase subunit beta (sulfur reductase)